ncbi:MAG: 50S ribosomal protein L30 [Chloroflexi bacterium]|nr:50S ribosomal protein L30 [Chloroflexota bacterium]
MARLRITWVKSAIGYSEEQKRTIRALGFRRLRESVERDDSPTVRGMINRVRHLVKVDSPLADAQAQGLLSEEVER